MTSLWISDLFWEQHYEIIPMDAYPHAEAVDKELPQYIPPENVLELGNNQNVRVELTRDNYMERMHYLLFLEEHEHKKIMGRYPSYIWVVFYSQDQRHRLWSIQCSATVWPQLTQATSYIPTVGKLYTTCRQLYHSPVYHSTSHLDYLLLSLKLCWFVPERVALILTKQTLALSWETTIIQWYTCDWLWKTWPHSQ